MEFLWNLKEFLLASIEFLKRSMEFRGIPWARGAHELLEGSWSLAAISRNAARIVEKIGLVVEVGSIQILDGAQGIWT